MSDSPLIDWQDGQPFSRLYGDVFFSRASGIEETQHVFLEQNRLAERWRALPPGSNFLIGETGFGTGLNFLCAMRLWGECAPADAWLHCFSVEKHPLGVAELKAALELWPQLATQRDALLNQYSALAPGWHRFLFAEARVTLTLAVEDAAAALTQLDVGMDAWFLDGFSPARNPDMWSPEVLQAVAQHTKAGGTFATYTAAGEVRRTLQAAGFAVERVAGHGSKREMLRGTLAAASKNKSGKPWFARPAPSAAKKAVVIGGGLAGTSAAWSLALRGWEVELLERYGTLASGASGNDQGILYMRLSAHATPLHELLIAGYSYSRRLIGGLGLSAEDYSPCGLLQVDFDAEEHERQNALAAANFPVDFLRRVNRGEAETLTGIPLPAGGLWFSQSGWVHPPALCAALVTHPRIRVRCEAEALELHKSGDLWQVMSQNGVIAAASVVLIATARESTAFEQSAHLPLSIIRGQISALPQNAASAKLRAVVCGESYLAPARRGLHTLGATHKFRDHLADVRIEEHEENLQAMHKLVPALHAQWPLEAGALQGRAGLRISTPDYLPVIGPLVDAQAFNQSYAALSRDAKLEQDAPAPWLEGLYISTAHGSRGLISAPLAGEMLAAYLNGEPAALPGRAMEAMHPSRFLLRDLIRRRSA